MAKTEKKWIDLGLCHKCGTARNLNTLHPDKKKGEKPVYTCKACGGKEWIQ